MIEAGTTLQQRYRIDKQIGQGGMGAVYVATDERFGSTVAIKETLCMDDNFRKAIEREARLLNSLKHPALPRVSDHFLESEVQFLVMEYIQGEDLCRMQEDQGKAFDVDQVLIWADQLLDALDYLHNQTMPVVHRDIKPQNLKITAGGQIILLDFGLAKGNPTDAGNHTAAKSIFGYSRNYASLEQIQGTGTDPRSDLYSLAATLYHLITNIPPEDALTRAMAVLSHQPDPLVPANVVDPNIPAGVAGVLQNALALNANERPASAAEMRQMLRENEKYAYLAESASSLAAFAGNTNVFSQPTRLMSEKTRGAELFATDVRTEVRSSEGIEETSANLVPTSSRAGYSPPKRRGLGIAVGTLVVLLVGGLVAGGVYVVKPSFFGVGQSVEQTTPPSTLPSTSAVSPDVSQPIQMSANSASNANAVANSTHESARVAEKPAETTKNGKTTEKPKASEDDTVNITGDPDDPDQVIITRRGKNGKVTTMTVNPNEMPDIPHPPAEGVDPFPNNSFDPSKLSPELRRRIVEKAMRKEMLRLGNTQGD